MKKVLLIALLFCIKQINAQTCQAIFTYTQGANGQVTFTSTSTGTTANTSYFWNWDDSNAQISNGPTTHTFYYNGTYLVSLTITDSAAGCSSTKIDTVIVTTALPCNIHASVGINIDTVTSMVTFTNTSTGMGSNATYTLHTGNGTGAMGSGQYWATTNNFPYNGQYVATLTVTGGGCTSTFADTFNITNGLTCNLATAFTDTLRNNGQVDFYNTSTGVLSNMKAIWYYGDGTQPDTVNAAMHSHNYMYNGTYHVKLYILDNYHQCKDSAVTTINITNAPNACVVPVSFTLTPDSSHAHAWFATPNYSPQTTNATWTWGDGSSSTGLYPSHTYTAAGNYNICVTVYYTCGDSATYCQTDSLSKNAATSQIIQISVIHNIAGISHMADIKNQVNVYPNPAQNNFVIETNIAENQTLQVFDVNGNLILAQTINGTTSIDANNLSNGIYNLSIIGSTGLVNKKLIIVK
ncbi:MAG TPA: PKD domain-containing protein [Bacteroidia bacterium]|nr:PKD domain-containing protein [Bacteroidia bacterium]